MKHLKNDLFFRHVNRILPYIDVANIDDDLWVWYVDMEGIFPGKNYVNVLSYTKNTVYTKYALLQKGSFALISLKQAIDELVKMFKSKKPEPRMYFLKTTYKGFHLTLYHGLHSDGKSFLTIKTTAPGDRIIPGVFIPKFVCDSLN